jgi:hypothetical protein
MNDTKATILIVPGLRDHVAQHWQTLLEAKLSTTRKVRTVPPLDTDKFSRAARVAALNKVVSEIDGPIVMIAHSGGCITVAHWAQEHQREIRSCGGRRIRVRTDRPITEYSRVPSRDPIRGTRRYATAAGKAGGRALSRLLCTWQEYWC